MECKQVAVSSRELEFVSHPGQKCSPSIASLLCNKTNGILGCPSGSSYYLECKHVTVASCKLEFVSHLGQKRSQVRYLGQKRY